MSLKKYLKRCGMGIANGGQVVIEYFILFVVLVALTIVGRSALFSQFRGSMDTFNRRSLVRMQTVAGDTDFNAAGLDPSAGVAASYGEINFRTPRELAEAGGDAFWGEGDNGLPPTENPGNGGPGGPGFNGTYPG